MISVRGTLVTDGSRDSVLVPIVEWAMRACGASGPVVWADLRTLPQPPRALADRARAAVDLHPCDVLFVHRDSESVLLAERRHEIESALADYGEPYVCVVPVRMTEAWLLLDAKVIAEAAGNPSAAPGIRVPAVSKLESLPDPKGILHGFLLDGCGLSARRKRQFRLNPAVHRVAQLTSDFGALRALAAFQAFEAQVVEIVRQFAEPS